MHYIKLLNVPLKCPKCGITRVAMGMKQNLLLQNGQMPSEASTGICPDCGEIMEIDEQLRNL